MAKAPLVGSVKTRLVPPLTLAEAAELSICFIRDTTENIAELTRTDGVDGFVAYAPPGASKAFSGLLPSGFKLLEQRGDSLGDRLPNTAGDLFYLGYDSICLINSDSPTLPRTLLSRAIASLSLPGDRVVLGQSEDGGYYLIGLKKAHSVLFDRIPWSTSEVLAHTIERAAEINLEVELLPPWYDVDDQRSLRLLCEELFAEECSMQDGLLGGYAALHTRSYLAQLLKRVDGSRLSFNKNERVKA